VPAAAPKSAVYIFIYMENSSNASHVLTKIRLRVKCGWVMNSAFFPVINENSLGAFGVDKRGNGRAESRLSRTLRVNQLLGHKSFAATAFQLFVCASVTAWG